MYSFLVGNRGLGPFAKEVDVSLIERGDIVQISFDGTNFAHTPVVVAVGNPPSPRNIMVAAHTFDAYNRPLSTYIYQKLRFLHIEGVRDN